MLTRRRTTTQLPPPGPPEIAFAGRSNAGKSSAINALANRTRLAFTSKTPGRTQQINFFRLRRGALLADLPGYGYAAVPQALKRHWQEFLAPLPRDAAVARRARAHRRRAARARRPRRAAARGLSHERPAGAAARDQDGQARGVGAARRRSARSSGDVAAAFPAARRAGDGRAVLGDAPHRHRGGGGDARAIGSAIGVRRGRADDPAGAKEKAPRSRGVARGPKHPR